MTLATATRLGPYEILAPLGAGGMGEVYRARDPRLGREVAIKVLPEALADDPSRLGRFEREAKATGALNHPHILAIHDIGEHERRPYVVYELLEGQTLRERMREGPLPPHEALTWATQVAQGLAAAHAKSIVHRDLKPENLFLTNAGLLKILDFGLAKVARPEVDGDASIDPEDLTAARESLTAEGAILGTVGYMSPEQVKGERADHRSDIFSLGVVLYEMLSGRRPFKGGTAPETMAAILKEDPPVLPEEEISPPIAEVVGRCLAKAPEERFQSAHDLALALEVLAASVAEKRPEVSAVAPPRAPVRWGSRLLLLAGALVVVAGVILALRHLVAPAGPPRVANPRLVHSTKSPLYGTSTDGRWLYYSSWDHRLIQLSVAGGETKEILPWPDRRMFLSVLSLSPVDPTQLLVDAAERPRGINLFEPFPLWVLSLPSGAPRRVGEISTNSAVWSPDGEAIAYSDVQSQAILVVDKDGASPRKVADVEGFPWVFDWSGERILYCSFDPDRWSLEPWEVSTAGGEPRRLLEGWPDPMVWAVRRAPGGRHLLFVAGGQTGGRLFALEEGAAEPVLLTREPLAFFNLYPVPGHPTAYTQSVRIRIEPFVYRPEIEDWAPSDFWLDPSGRHAAWSADGQWVAWSSILDGTLWRARADGTQRLRLTEPRGDLHAGFIAWSPDAERIVFTTGTLEGIPRGAAFVVSRGGEGLKQLSEEGVVPNRPAWSPDGRVVLSFADESEGGPGELPLRLVDPETGESEEMPGTSDRYGAAASPNGRFLAAHGREVSPQEGIPIHLFDWESGQWRTLDGAFGEFFQWSLDSRFLYFFPFPKERWCVKRYRLADGHVETVAEEGSLDAANPLRAFSVDPQGRVVVMRSQNLAEIHAWDLVLP